VLDDAKVSTFIDTIKYFVKKSFQLSTKTLGTTIKELIISVIESEKSEREVARKTGLSNTAIGNIKTGTSIKLDTLDQIIAGYPDLEKNIAEVVLSRFGQNSTAATNNIEAAESVESLVRVIEDQSKQISSLTQANLVNAQTISQLLSREVVKQA